MFPEKLDTNNGGSGSIYVHLLRPLWPAMEGHAGVVFQGGLFALMKGLGTRGGQSRLSEAAYWPYECKAHVSSRWGPTWLNAKRGIAIKESPIE